MLISFRVANFLSFNDEVEFSMLAGQPRQLPSHIIHVGEGRNRIDILKSAVIYGANASGKSNLIKAMDFARNIIVNGVKSEVTTNRHFRLDPTNIDKPSKFEFEFKIGEKIYAYGFTIQLSTQKFKSEWLTEVGKTTDKPIFEREVLEDGKSNFKTYLKFSHRLKTRIEIYQEDILENQLFVEELSSKKLDVDVFEDVFHWFEVHLVIQKIPSFENLNLSLARLQLLNNSDIKKYLLLFNTGIKNVKTVDVPIKEIESIDNTFNLTQIVEELKMNKNISKEDLFPFVFFHDGKEYRINLSKDAKGNIKTTQLIAQSISKGAKELVDFKMEDLSDGTRRILDLLPFLKVSEKFDYTFIIDEIDRSLHPELTRKLLEIFHTNTEGVESQLIVTTHESSLLDLNLLRRDEIWFAEKNEKGESHLYSLEEFKPRHDIELRKAYLLGRFGAIPFISDVKTLGWSKEKITNRKEKSTPSV